MKSTKKRIIIVFAILTMALVLSCAFVACDKVEPDKTGTDPDKTGTDIVSEYKVTIHPNNGQGDIVWDITKAIPTITKDGFHIAGYFLDAQLTISTTLESLKATGITKNIDVYVKWAKHDYKDGVCIVCGIRRPSEGLTYSLNSDGNGYKVTGIGTCTDKELIIPSEYNAKPVTSIGHSAFSGCTELTSVTIPDSVTSIGYYAFRDCTGLTSVTIGGSVTSIGHSAFSGCTGLTSITIPASVTSIGESAFNGCKGLTSITIPDSVTSIGNSAFYNCTGLTSITIPDSVTSIGEYAFYSCDGLKSVTIPDSVTSIGRSAFEDCTGLTSVTIGKGVTSIGSWTFYNCTGLKRIKFNGTIKQWNAISQGYKWNLNVPATQVICMNGTVSIYY